MVNHIVYPGTISRVIREREDGLWVFTHGIGINRQFCQTDPRYLPVNFFYGWANDTYGPKAFKQLDKEMTEYWQQSYGLTGFSSMSAVKPASLGAIGGVRSE